MDSPWRMYTLDEVSELTGLSARWLADQCRANKIEHTKIESGRRLTSAQIESMIAQHRAGPPDLKDLAAQARYLDRLQQKQRKVPKQ